MTLEVSAVTEDSVRGLHTDSGMGGGKLEKFVHVYLFIVWYYIAHCTAQYH